MLLSRNRPPGNANFPLLSRWRRLGSGGLPILVLKAPDLKSRGIQPGLGEFDYLKYIQKSSGPGNQIVVKFVEGTNHSFADRLGRSSVRQLTGQWLHAHFPLIEHQGHVPNPLPSEPSGVESRTVNYELR
jgi:hypothetical protein